MSTEHPPETIRTLMSPKIWLGPYAIVVAALYLGGYWGAFHINALEYVTLTEVVKATVYPIASAFAAFAIGAVIGEFLAPIHQLPPGGGVNTKTGKVLRKIMPVVAIAYTAGIALYLIFGPVEKWRFIYILFAITVYLPLRATELLAQELKNDGARSIAIFLLAALPPFAYGRGVLEANDVLYGLSYATVISEVPGHEVASGTKPSDRLRYIGRLNDRYILFDPVAESTLFVAASELKILTLKQKQTTDTMHVASPSSNAESASIHLSTRSSGLAAEPDSTAGQNPK